ncbi:MAG: response regulator [Thermodesulfobacteriota bacterium]|nr:response regulator [Thermodesulfobacteriota bacterium]
MKILLVDDEKKFVSSLAERLTMRGIAADWTTTCEEALEKAPRPEYDIAILDVKMPHMSGIELKKEIEAKRPDMQFIFVTGHGSEESYKAGTREAASYIIKPFKIDLLIEKINELREK